MKTLQVIFIKIWELVCVESRDLINFKLTHFMESTKKFTATGNFLQIWGMVFEQSRDLIQFKINTVYGIN